MLKKNIQAVTAMRGGEDQDGRLIIFFQICMGQSYMPGQPGEMTFVMQQKNKDQ